MTYARIKNDGTIIHPFRVPRVLREPDGDHDLRDGSAELLASYGIFEVVRLPRPDDTDTTTSDRDPITVVGGVPVIGWTVRPWTAEESAARDEAAADEAERDAAKAAWQTLGQYLELNNPTTAQIKAVVEVLAKVGRRMIRDQYGE